MRPAASAALLAVAVAGGGLGALEPAPAGASEPADGTGSATTAPLASPPPATPPILFPPAGVRQSGTVGIDARHGYDTANILATGADLSQFRAIAMAQGATLVPLTSFLAIDLAGLDALILHTPYTQNLPGTGYSAAEMADIQAFVAGGGGLMACGNSGTGSDTLTPNFNQLLAPFGISLASAGTEPVGHTIRTMVPHPVTTCVDSFGVDYQQRLTTVAPGTDLTPGGGADNALSVRDGGTACGNVVVISDTTMFTNPGTGADTPIDYADNQRLVENMIHFILCEPIPPTCVLLEVVFDRVAARAVPGGVEVSWRTLREERTLGFRIEQAAAEDGPFVPAGPAVSAGGAGSTYVWLDPAARPGAAWYRVVELSDDGRSSVSPPVRAAVDTGRSRRRAR